MPEFKRKFLGTPAKNVSASPGNSEISLDAAHWQVDRDVRIYKIIVDVGVALYTPYALATAPTQDVECIAEVEISNSPSWGTDGVIYHRGSVGIMQRSDMVTSGAAGGNASARIHFEIGDWATFFDLLREPGILYIHFRLYNSSYSSIACGVTFVGAVTIYYLE